LIFEGMANKLLAIITSPQGGFSIQSEEICEEKGVPYTRLGLYLNKPVNAGKFIITFSPTGKEGTN
jgi:hypothetical protein